MVNKSITTEYPMFRHYLPAPSWKFGFEICARWAAHTRFLHRQVRLALSSVLLSLSFYSLIYFLFHNFNLKMHRSDIQQTKDRIYQSTQ